MGFQDSFFNVIIVFIIFVDVSVGVIEDIYVFYEEEGINFCYFGSILSIDFFGEI